jgi:hypothetical protein
MLYFILIGRVAYTFASTRKVSLEGDVEYPVLSKHQPVDAFETPDDYSEYGDFSDYGDGEVEPAL